MRAIVTSRITLIEKAEIPEDAIIIRLQEFDEEKRNKWISVWNSANSHYFRLPKTADYFKLPKDNEKIISLAKQPLLLLMLALYDSESNQLRKQKNLDQAVLYHSLLVRFIERELMKLEWFNNLKRPLRNGLVWG